MECFACIRACPTNALEMGKGVSCVRLGGSPLRINEEKCNKCNRCIDSCPMGDITLSAEGCLFCIICKSNPSCIVSVEDRCSFLSLTSSIARFIVLMRRIIFQ